jgi:hypothetical protein
MLILVDPTKSAYIITMVEKESLARLEGYVVLKTTLEGPP